MIRFSISIALFNHCQTSKNCLEALRALDGFNEAEVLFFNNASTDDTASWLDSLDDPAIRVTHSATNVGFGEAHNRNFERAQGQFFFVLNNDLMIDDRQGLTKMAACFTGDATLGVVGFDNQFCSVAADGTVSNGSRVDYIDGSAMMMQRQTVLRLGLFARYLLLFYWEDVDLSLRYQQAGMTLKRLPIAHRHAQGTSAAVFRWGFVAAIKAYNFDQLCQRWQHYLDGKPFCNLIFIENATAETMAAVRHEHPTAAYRVRENPHQIADVTIVDEIPAAVDRVVRDPKVSPLMRAGASAHIDLELLQPLVMGPSVYHCYEENQRLSGRLRTVEAQLAAIKRGPSFRLGRLLTAPLRILFSRWREE